MSDKKYSVTLSAKDQMSAAFDSVGAASSRLRKEVDETNKQIKQLGDTSKRSADFGTLRREMEGTKGCLLYTSPSPRDRQKSRMPSSA